MMAVQEITTSWGLLPSLSKKELGDVVDYVELL
jgi:hypothetical protein